MFYSTAVCVRACAFCWYLSVTDAAACHLCFRARGWSPAWCDAVTSPAACGPSTSPSTSATSCCWTSAVTSGSTTPWVSVRAGQPGQERFLSRRRRLKCKTCLSTGRRPWRLRNRRHKITAYYKVFFFSFKGLKKNVRITLAQMTYILINVITALSIFQARQRGKRCKCESEKLCFAPHRNVLKAKKKKTRFQVYYWLYDSKMVTSVSFFEILFWRYEAVQSVNVGKLSALTSPWIVAAVWTLISPISGFNAAADQWIYFFHHLRGNRRSESSAIIFF